MFEKASRIKLRFETSVGKVSVEDLWDIPLLAVHDRVSLDEIAKGINKTLKASEEESFVTKKSHATSIHTLKLDIVKHIIKVKLAEIEAAENAALIKEKKAKILSIIAEKEDDSLKNKSLASLKKMVAEL